MMVLLAILFLISVVVLIVDYSPKLIAPTITLGANAVTFYFLWRTEKILNN